MPNIYDYVQWRGDLSFAERPFTEIDNLVLCQIAYIDLRRALLPSSAASRCAGDSDNGPDPDADGGDCTSAQDRDRPEPVCVCVRDAIGKLVEQGGSIDTLIIDGEERREEYTAFAMAAAASHRFGDLMMEDYVDIRDDALQTQFAAVTFRLDGQTDFIAFRGTDDSIVGWKEDFMISFTRVAAQNLALDYLRRHLSARQAYVGGHSKGANLALYAASLLLSEAETAGPETNPPKENAPDPVEPDRPSSCQTRHDPSASDLPHERQQGRNSSDAPSGFRSRLLHVYLNDGPGLCDDVLDTSVILAADPIATRIVPEYDVIGKIFEMPITDSRIVRSTGSGVMQHGMITWQLKNAAELDLAPENAPGSVWIGEVLDKWIGGVDPAGRETFVNELFAILCAGGNETFAELSKLGPEGLEKILAQAAGTSPVTWDVAASLPRAAAIGVGQREHQSTVEYIRGLFRRGTYSRGLALIAAGLACMAMPARLFPFSLNAVIIAFLLYEVWYIIRRLKESHWHLSSVQIQLFILLFSLAAWFIITVKENALMLISNLLYGGIFLFLSYRSFSRIGRAEGGDAPEESRQGTEEPRTGNDSPGRRSSGAAAVPGRKKSLLRSVVSHPARSWNLAEGIFLLLLAVVMLTAPFDVVTVCTFILGGILTVDGIIHLISVYRSRRNR